jgi:DNA invertase Pin-like site-specific DNA recombinase
MRVSKSDGSQKTDSQEHEVKRYCAARGWKNLEIYADKASGAKTTRPALEKMMQNMRAGKIQRVVCYKLDRLGRSLTHLCLMLDEMKRLHVPLICVTQGIDTSSDNPTSALQLSILGAVCSFERALICERVNSGLKAAVANGVKLGRPATLGKHRDEVMGLRKQGKGIREIARELKMPVASVFKVIKGAE